MYTKLDTRVDIRTQTTIATRPCAMDTYDARKKSCDDHDNSCRRPHLLVSFSQDSLPTKKRTEKEGQLVFMLEISPS